LTGFGASVLAILNDGDAIYKYVWDADGIMVRIIEGGGIADFCGIEYDDVGPVTFAEFATFFEMKGVRGQAGHFADCILEFQNVQFANVAAKDASVVTVAARMGNAFAEFPQSAVTCNHGIRMAHEFLQIFFAHAVENALSAAVERALRNGTAVVDGSWMVVPMKAGDRVLGAITLGGELAFKVSPQRG